MLYPFTFIPRFKERIWGGRRLAGLYGKPLPPGKDIGESWEISDRPGDESVIANGPLAGRTIRWLMEQHASDVLGDARPAAGNRFPLLCKILDARDTLSLQVHPPAHKAAELGGEPKTEMWHIAAAQPDAQLYVGLRAGVTRGEFEAKIRTGQVAECFHRIAVERGDTMFLPSGRVHAIGAGLVIFEIQQNSDTTYRVFDWNRVGADGLPRELHVEQSLASIDFDDFEPALAGRALSSGTTLESRTLVRHELFVVDEHIAQRDARLALPPRQLRVVAVVDGRVELSGNGRTVALGPGDFGLIPAALDDVAVQTHSHNVALLVVQAS